MIKEEMDIQEEELEADRIDALAEQHRIRQAREEHPDAAAEEAYLAAQRPSRFGWTR